MSKTFKISVSVILIFAISVLLFFNSGKLFSSFTSNKELKYCLAMSLWIIIPLIATKFLFPKSNPFSELGLNRQILRGTGIAFLMCVPMMIGAIIFFKISDGFNFSTIIAYCLFASLGEEILFRGFLFGHLFRHAKWGIVLADFIEAFLFGVLHLSQSHNSTQALGVFAITFAGGLWFAWLYTEWAFNLWVPIVLHCLMNTVWMVFNVADNALGGTIANIIRLLTVILSIYMTIKFAKKGEKMVINRRNLFVNKGN